MSIEELEKGKLYRVVVWGNKRTDGTRSRMVRRVHGGIRAAQDAERSLIAERDEGKDSTPKTVAQYAEKFLASKKREGRADRTLAHYRQSFALLPQGVSSKRMAKVTTGDLRSFFNSLSNHSGSYRNGIERDVKALFRQAALDGDIKADPGRRLAKTQPDAEEPMALTEEEAAAFLEQLRPSPVYLPALVMYCTGLRPAEMLGLQHRNLSLSDDPHLTVEKSVVMKGGRPALGEVKTKRSRRSLRLPTECADLLRAHLARQEEAAERYGPHWAGLGLVFPAMRASKETYEAGRIWSPTAFSHAWSKARGKWTQVVPYTMRHTFATQRLLEGVRLEVVSRLLGHGNSATTARHYSHVLPDELHEVIVAVPTIKA